MSYLSLTEFIQQGGKVEIVNNYDFLFIFPSGFRYQFCTDGNRTLEDGLARVDAYLLRDKYEQLFTPRKDP